MERLTGFGERFRKNLWAFRSVSGWRPGTFHDDSRSVSKVSEAFQRDSKDFPKIAGNLRGFSEAFQDVPGGSGVLWGV